MPGIVDEVRAAVDALEDAVARFEPGVLPAAATEELVELFVRGERLCAAGKGMAARRVEQGRSWKREGYRSAAHWFASKAGVSVGSAVRSLQTARRLEALPHAQEAFRAGELSEAQAGELAAAAHLDPNLDGELVDAARTEASFKGFRDTCRAAAASARDDQAWARRLHRSRAVHTWTEADQAWRMDVRLSPEDAGYVHQALEDMTDELGAQARQRGGLVEPRAAYRADALVALVRGGPCRPVDVRLHVTEAAVERGYVEPGEHCEIDGIGPVPVTVARHLVDDSRVTVLHHRGEAVEVASVSSPKRSIPAALRRWLEATYPVCGAEGCANDRHLEIDHVVPLEEHGATERDNLWRLCPHDHKLKTFYGWRVEATDRGTRRLVPPDRRDAPRRRERGDRAERGRDPP